MVLSHDFWGEARGIPVESLTEKDFLLATDSYKVRGFIDRLFIYQDGHALIRDYKTSKATYMGHEATTDSLQASMYAMAVKKLWPQIKSISVEFLFLKFDCNLESKWETGVFQGKVTKKLYHNGGGKITLDYDFEEIEGFEEYLGGVQNYFDNFTEEDAVKNFAADQEESKNGSFIGPVVCGFSSRPNELKKDGSPKWNCSFKFGFPYYFITKDNEWVKSCFLDEREKLLAEYPLDTYTWEEKMHEGCPSVSKKILTSCHSLVS